MWWRCWTTGLVSASRPGCAKAPGSKSDSDRMTGKHMRDKRGITWEMKIYYGTIILLEIINITWQRQTFIICILFWWFHCCTGCCPPWWWCPCRPEGSLERRRQPFLTAEALSGQDGEERTRSGLACRSLEIKWKGLFLNSLIGWYGVMWYYIKCFKDICIFNTGETNSLK